MAPPVLRAPDVRYEPAPMEVVHVMLRLAQVSPGDVVYDLGCGDGAYRHRRGAGVRRARRLCRYRPLAHHRKPGERASGERHRSHPVHKRRSLRDRPCRRHRGDALPLSRAEPCGAPEAAARAQAWHSRRLPLAPHGRLEAAGVRARSKRRARESYLSLDRPRPLRAAPCRKGFQLAMAPPAGESVVNTKTLRPVARPWASVNAT